MVESLLGGALPSAWSDEAAVLVGAGRVAPDEQQRDEIGSVVQPLPVLG
jgi:hypothetical protein